MARAARWRAARSLMRVLTVGNMYPPHHHGGLRARLAVSSDAQLRSRGHEVRVLTTDHGEPGVTARDDGDVHRELRWYWRDHAWPRLGLLERLRLERHNARALDAPRWRNFGPTWSPGGRWAGCRWA